MTTTTRPRITLERTYAASLEDVWEMWTTKEGIESWWGPDGFRVEVHQLDLRPGGELLYSMIADAPEMVAFMKQQGMPTATLARITFQEIVEKRRLSYIHLADFIPGVTPYDVATVLELHADGEGVRLVLSFDAMHDPVWTERQTMGWQSELEKLRRALAA
jgi:uncharacterized protein YndB with AHSA1/START domain